MSRHQAPPPAGRITWVDTGRGIAIILVALFHATNWLSGIGLDESLWSTINETVATLRMPLFFTLSGLFAAKWLTASWPALATAKLALFAWMFLLWGAVGSAVQLIGLAARGDHINPLGTIKQYLLSPLEPRLELWFIWALGLFFVIAKLSRRVPAAVQLAVAAVVSALALTDWSTHDDGAFWADLNVGWTGMAKYYLFFMTGLLARRRIIAAVAAITPVRGAIVLACWLVLSITSVVAGGRSIPGMAFVTALSGVAAGLVLAKAFSRIRLLPFLGARTLPVYVTHTPLIILMVAVLGTLVPLPAREAAHLVLPPLLAAAAITGGVLLDTAVRGTRLRVLFTTPHRRIPGGTVSDPITVMQSFPEPRATTNPYIVMLRDALRTTDGVTVRTFGWRAAIFGRYQVFHVHWPEILPRGSSPLKTVLRHLATAMLLVRWRLSGTRLVRTQHNIASHERAPRPTRALLNAIDRATTVTIDLNGQTPPLLGRPQRTILHGHYRDWYREQPQPRAVPGRLGCVGMIRPYKGIDNLVSAVHESTDQTLSLLVAGRPINDEVLSQLHAAADGDWRVSIHAAFLSDAVFVRSIRESELVVLPYPAMLNSGGALAALSLGRPVLVPDNPVTRALAEEVGSAWVQRFEGALSAATLHKALRTVRRDVRGRPELSAREWGQAGADHLETYRFALGASPRRNRIAPQRSRRVADADRGSGAGAERSLRREG